MLPVSSARRNLADGLSERFSSGSPRRGGYAGVVVAFALSLSAIGIYGVLAYSITERTREIGIRMALGAEKSDITQMVLKRSLLLVSTGVALGVAGALVVTRVLAKFLFDVKPTDPATFGSVTAVLVVVAVAATLVPALRATRIDPLTALREE